MTKLSLKKFQTPAKQKQNQILFLFTKSNLILSLPSPHATIVPSLSQTPTLTATTQLRHFRRHNTIERCKFQRDQPLSCQKTSKSSFSSKTILRRKLSCSFQHSTVTRRVSLSLSLSLSLTLSFLFLLCIFTSFLYAFWFPKLQI